MQTYDTLILGGGIAGSSLAGSLAERHAGRGVGLVDPHLYGTFSSSERNGGGVRSTFAEPINIRISLASTRWYMANAATVDYRPRGYVWMYPPALWDQSREFLPLVRSFGLPVEELTPRQTAEKFPYLSDLSDLAGATWTPFDGRLSPHLLRMHYLDVARAGGVDFLDGWQVVHIDGTASPYRVTLRKVTPATVQAALTTDPATGSGPPAEERVVRADRLVNSAGAWAPKLAELYGRPLPVSPVPRQVFLLEHAGVNLESEPFFLDYPQEIYFRYVERDGKPYTLVSWSDPEERRRVDFTYAGEAYYRQHVERRMLKRIPALKDATLGPGWAGHYELTPDKSAIVGPVPGRPGLFNLNGLSAHGVMQSRGLGEAMADLLTTGAWSADLNLDELNENRFEGADKLSETMYV